MPELPDPQILIAGVFIATLVLVGGIGGLAAVVSGRSERRRRLERAAGHRLPIGRPAAASLRRDQTGGRFKTLELLLRRLLPGTERLRARIAQTGYRLPLSTYLLVCLSIALVAGLGLLLLLGPGRWMMAAPVGLALGWLLPRLVVAFLAGRRTKQFMLELPDAIDVIVRGLKSGLPITEAIATVAKDFKGPVGQEFKLVDDQVRFGRTVEEALWDVAKRLDIPEFNFLAISIGVQRETGGNLTETLGNLSNLLRRRQQMRLKIRALSSEARASAYIVGCLPFLMAGLMYLLNPEYMGRMFTDPRGHIMLAAALGSELLGAAIMFRLVRFEI